MSRPCPIDTCERPAPGGQPVCGACRADLERALRAVPDLTRELDVNLSRQVSRMGRGGNGVAPLPFDARASEAGYVLRSALVGWVRDLTQDAPARQGPSCRACAHPSCLLIAGPSDDMGSMARWLLAGFERLLSHPAVDEAYGEIVDAVRGAERATDRPAERQFAGRCACGVALYAKPGAAVVQCRDCDAGAVDVAEQRAAMLAQIEDQLATSTQAAHILTRLAAPLRASTVRKWGERSRLVAHGRDPHGHPLYRIGEVLELLVAKLAREADLQARRDAEQAAGEQERMAS